MKWRKRAFELLWLTRTRDRTARVVNFLIVTLIAISVLDVILGSVRSIEIRLGTALRILNIVTVLVFSLEYATRVWACVEDERFRHPMWGRLRFALTPMALIDLLAIAPFYLPALISIDLRVLRVLRLIRLLRLFKLARYSKALQLLGRVLKNSREELTITAFTIAMLLILASSFIYYAERDVQPDAFSSIPASMWWGVITMTTVGYGDMSPVTPVGKVIASLMALLGIGLFALPAGIISNGFMEEVQKTRRKKQKCPNCGTTVE